MSLLKDDKKKLAKQYVQLLEGAKNVVIVQHQGIPVNEINAIRMELGNCDGVLQVVKKRVFLKSIDGLYAGFDLSVADGGVALVLSYNEDDEHAPLKIIQNRIKKRKKDKMKYSIKYLGGWYADKDRKDDLYVTELAGLPTKEELIGKFLFMMNHPVSSFARVLKAVADSGDSQGSEKKENKEGEA